MFYSNCSKCGHRHEADFDGVNLIAIQTLERRTTELKEVLDRSTKMIAELKKEAETLKNQNKNLAAK